MFVLAIEGSDDIQRQPFAFPHSILRRGRTRLPRLGINDMGAIAQGPYARILWDFQELVHHNATTLLLARQRQHHRVRSSADSGHESLGRDVCAIAQDGLIPSDRSEARVESDIDFAACQESLGIET